MNYDHSLPYHELRTANCVICGEPATSWCGHVHLNDADSLQVLAGWCKKHVAQSPGFRPFDAAGDCAGCAGAWNKQYGIEVAESVP